MTAHQDDTAPQERHAANAQTSAHESLDRRRFLALAGAAGLTAASMPAGAVFAQDQPRRESLEGVCVLITGCSTGFGNLTARSLAREGATVVA
ncbi:MAG: hypothetical protein AAGI30_04360 [Planctomycetota bacterium]